jgi:non-specific serine/threonine protein kinase
VAAEGLPLTRQLGNRLHFVRFCGQIAWVARSQGDPERATRLLGAAQVLREAHGETDTTVEPGEHEAELATLRAALGDNRFEAAWAAGRAMSPDQAHSLAVEVAACTVAAAPAPDTGAAQLLPATGLLSRREQEVATMVAEGLSNPQIAGRLGLSDRTIDAHLRNIMGKLAVTSRAQVAAWSVKHGRTAPPQA